MKERGYIRSKESDKYSKYDDGAHHSKTEYHRKSHKHSKRGYNSDSNSYDSDDKDRIREELKHTKYSDYKKSKWENNDRSDSHTYSNVRVKEEPISEDERDRKNSRPNRKELLDRWRGDRPKRSRWNEGTSRDNDESPVRMKRPKEEDRDHKWGKPGEKHSGEKKTIPTNVAKPDFGLSGKLAEETNMYNGVVIKYSEPPEARKPKRRWRLYPFKGDEGLPTLHIHRQSAFLIGRDRKVADIPIDHPSCSKQHAALQYRLVPYENSEGRVGKRISPYIIDLESANGTFINNVKIEAKKYVQLFEKDVVKFAFSSREYVLLHEHSKDSDEDDNM